MTTKKIKQNKLYLISGTGGSGKTNIMKQIMNNEVISFTTREPRLGEVDMVHYHFINKKEFKRMLDSDELVEYTEYSNNWYGTEDKMLKQKLSITDAYLVCDVNGMKQMKQYYPNCKSIFIYSEKEEIEERMRKRGDSEENIQKRLDTYDQETQNAYLYDEIVVNRDGDIEETIQKIRDIIAED